MSQIGAARAVRYVLGQLEVDGGRRRVRWAGGEIRLTPMEFDILLGLAEAEGQVVPYGELLDRVYRGETGHTRGDLKTAVCRMRATFAAAGAPGGLFRNSSKNGYALEVELLEE